MACQCIHQKLITEDYVVLFGEEKMTFHHRITFKMCVADIYFLNETINILKLVELF